VTDDLDSDDRRALVGVAAAERAFALIELWGKPKNVARAREILDDLWLAAAAPSARAGAELAAHVEKLPDARVTDPTHPHQLALEALFNAAWMIAGRREPHDLMTPYLFSGIDAAALDRAGELTGPRIIDPRNPPPPGPYEVEEEQRVQRDERDARAAGSAAEASALLRARAADERADLVERVRPLVEFY